MVKRLFLFGFALLALVSGAQTVITNVGCVTLAWDQPEPAPDGYWLYHSTNAATPFTNWTRIAYGPQTGIHTLRVFVPPGQHFFRLTGTNIIGESEPSNIVGTGTFIAPPANLVITSQVYTNQ